jgi:hypothetical protein
MLSSTTAIRSLRHRDMICIEAIYKSAADGGKPVAIKV